MDNVIEVLSKFKENLDGIINDCKDKIVDIEKKESFLQTLGDVVNYSKSDYLLLPFYDMEILSNVFEVVFPLSNSEFNKIKAAKYLIEASESVDKENFLQYNNAVKDVQNINDKLFAYYDKFLSENDLEKEKGDVNLKLEEFSIVFNIISDNGFSKLIDDVDLFEKVLKSCDLSSEEINVILDIAIKDNLKYLDANGIVVDSVSDEIREQNSLFQDSISDLSNLLANE